MAWIELHTNLRHHPKVLLLCEELTKKKSEIVGYLVCLWTWALEYAEDGDLSKYPPAIIEDACDWDGEKEVLFNALVGKFIDSDKKIHDWYDYVGKYLTSKYKTHNKAKLLNIKRKYRRRKNQSKTSPKPVQNQSGKGHLYLPTFTNQPKDFFPVFWEFYPTRKGRKVGKATCVELFKKLSSEDIRLLILATKNYAKDDRTKEGFAKDPERFLKKDFWRDWIGEAIEPENEAIEPENRGMLDVIEKEMRNKT